MIKILRESIYNRIMFSSFILIVLCNLVSLLLLYDRVSTTVCTVFTVMSTPIALMMALYPKLKRVRSDTECKASIKDKHFVGLIKSDDINKENRHMLLNRRQHRENIIKKIEEIFAVRGRAKGLILTGESGAGKSILLRFLEHDLKKRGYNVVVNKVYNSSRDFPRQFNRRKKNIFIFDQFEESIKFDTIERWIDENNNNFKNCVFIFSFPQKFLTGIYNKIYQKNQDFYLQSYVLYLNEDDENDYLEKIISISGLDEMLVRNMWKSREFSENSKYADERTTAMTCLLERELYSVKRGGAPLIEMEFLGEMVERYTGSDTVITDGNFIGYYFDRWVDEFDRKETAYAILTLFTRFEAYSLTDIKLITFDDSDGFDKERNGKLIYLLFNSLFLNYKLGSKGKKTKSDYWFSPQHEFVSRSIQKYLASKEVSSGVQCYVEHYRTNSKFEDYEDKVQKNYSNYTKKHSLLHIFLLSMLIFLVGFNIYTIFAGTISLDSIVHRIFITIVCFPAIFYIYNYCDKIMWVRGRIGAGVSSFVGMLAVTLSYIFPNLWGIFLGGEIIVFSLCLRFSMAHRLVKEAHDNLIKDFMIFLFIGLTISALGVIFMLFFGASNEKTWQSNLLKYSYYILFATYAVMSDINHIRYSYICNKIGYSNMFII